MNVSVAVADCKCCPISVTECDECSLIISGWDCRCGHMGGGDSGL